MSFLTATFAIMPVNLLEVAFCFLGIFGSALLWPNPRLRGICLLLGLMSILMAFNFVEETGLFVPDYLVTPALSFATGPALYLLVRPLVYADRPWCRKDMLHILPTLLALPFTLYTQVILALGSASILIYSILSFRLLSRYGKATMAMRADADSLSLGWVQVFLMVFALLIIEDIVRVNSQPFMSYTVRNTWYFLHQLAAFASFMWLVLLATRQPELFNELAYYDANVAEAENTGNDAFHQAIFSELDEKIRKEQWFRQPRLSLLDLSQMTGLTNRDISQAINHCSGTNFAEYVNRLRVDDVVAQLNCATDSKPNLLHLATAAGFNSKSSFNSRFKAQMGITPSAYLASQPKYTKTPS